MNKIVIPALLIALFLSVAPAVSAAPQEKLLARLTADIGDRTVQLDIMDKLIKVPTVISSNDHGHALKNPGFLPIRRLIIKCLTACKKEIKFEEEIDDFPLGAFRLWDGSSQLITIWGGATSYRVRVYSVDRTEIYKVFEESTIEAPQFVRVENDQQAIILVNRDFSGEKKQAFWVWDGGQYHPVPH